MDLELQIQSLITSFIFGLFLSFLFNLLYKFLFSKKTFFKIITNAIFVFSNTILYFFLLKKVNNGIVHLYFIIALIIGVFIGNKNTKKIRKKL